MLVSLRKKQIADFCRRWQITECSLFGSVLRDDFGPESDIDVLVTFEPDANHNVFDLVTMRQELEGIFGRAVDLMERQIIDDSQNYIRRKQILESAKVIYGPGSGIFAGC